MESYEIISCYTDETGEEYTSRDIIHVESWDVLRKIIKEMRKSGCYNIDATLIPGPEDI